MGLAATARAARGKGQAFPSAKVRYLDPATENPVFRLTDPAWSSRLPSPYARAASRRGDFLLLWSDRAGSPQAFRLDVRSGAMKQLTDSAEIDGASLTLMPDDRGCLYFDGGSLRSLNLSNLKEKEAYRVPAGRERAPGLAACGDGSLACFVERQNGISHLRILNLKKAEARTVLEAAEAIEDPAFRPGNDGVLYRTGTDGLCVTTITGSPVMRLKPQEGGVGPAFWAPHGRTALFLSRANNGAIYEWEPEADQVRLVAGTSRYAHFGVNGDASVFAGASASVAGPYILLLLRSLKRELTLCEHRSSAPGRVAPRFSPDSQRLFFESDRDGKPALYCIELDRLVEPTD